jgi:hypothetical protein
MQLSWCVKYCYDNIWIWKETYVSGYYISSLNLIAFTCILFTFLKFVLVDFNLDD